MYNLDKIDRKIIYELGKNSRLTYKRIAKNINSRKEIVAYRISQMIRKGVITKFVPVFALSKMNIFSSKIYIRLHGLNKEAEKRLYDSLVSNKNIAWVAKAVGRWDLFLGMYTGDIIDFSQRKDAILSSLSKYVKDYDVAQIEDAQVFNRDYLINKTTAYRKEFVFAGKPENIKLEKEELEIIRLIKNNARFQVLDIAKILGIDPRTVISKLKNLQRRGILQGYTVFIDLKKLNCQLHKLCIYLQNYDEKEISKLISFLKENPNTIHLIKSLGNWELEVEIESRDLAEIYDYISELKNRFPDTIKQIEMATITDELKLDFFPEKSFAMQ